MLAGYSSSDFNWQSVHMWLQWLTFLASCERRYKAGLSSIISDNEAKFSFIYKDLSSQNCVLSLFTSLIYWLPANESILFSQENEAVYFAVRSKSCPPMSSSIIQETTDLTRSPAFSHKLLIAMIKTHCIGNKNSGTSDYCKTAIFSCRNI